ncbi:MAG TPA: efflux RND transporter periplasmic adaptor subunit [Candidatus Paceibacterota bacterium]|nr:efflux RND transporter periplasmic adaptor subunit [Candidatus Paceibacterota bacterium]
MRDRFIAVLSFVSRPVVAIGGALIIGAAVLLYVWVTTSVAPSGVYAPVTTGSITEEVDVSGVVKAAHSTDLSFQIPGQVSATLVNVGDHVAAGQTLVTLDGASEAAALASAKANLEVQRANLASLQAGTRPEQLAIDETNATQAASALENAIQSAYVSADAAVHTDADQLFDNPLTTNPTLIIQVPDAMLANRIQLERAALEPLFATWQTSLASAGSAPETAAATGEADLKTIATFLNDLASALAETPAGGSLTTATLASYEASVNTARTNVASALAALTAADTANKAAAGALTLAKAGATQDDLNAEQALVDAAQAAVASAQVAVNETALAAPVAGTITAQNADIGETVSPGVPLVSMVADGKYEADASIPQTDIAKVKLGAAVDVTFDTYPSVAFPATVTTIDPAATVTNGVAAYGVTVTFTNDDPRVRAGMSGNLRIITATKDSVLQVPTSAVITDSAQQFVYVKGSAGPVETPVTTGIVSATGQTEITSGLTAGEEVLTFGASAGN